MRLIAFTGLPRSGKDTAAAYLVSKHSFVRRAFADPLKQAAAILLDRNLSEMNGEKGFDREAVLPEWGFSTRWFLQRFGTECLRDQIDKDFWIKRMRNSLSTLGRYVITDCRFPNEANLVRELGGAVIEIVRPGCTASGHISDAGVTPDWKVWNGGTLEELHEAVQCAINAYP